MAATIQCTTAWVTARLNIRSDRGASLVEYALLAALAAVACVLAMKSLGKGTSSKFSSINGDLTK